MDPVEIMDITFDEGENIGGVRAFRFAFVEWVAIFYQPVQGVVIIPPVMDGDHTFKNGYLTSDSADFKEDEERATGGSIWSMSFTGFVPCDTIQLRQQLKAMSRHFMIIELQDNNGLWRRIGTKRSGVKIEYAFSTGTGAAARNGYRIEVRWTYDAAAPIIDPAFVPDFSHLTSHESIGSETEISGDGPEFSDG